MQRKLRLLLLLVLFHLFPLASQAQTSKGNMLLGGSMSYSRTTSNHILSTSSTRTWTTHKFFSVRPDAGYFISDNLALGTGLSFTLDRTLLDDERTNQVKGWGISPFVRYYKFIREKLALFGQGGIGFSKRSQNSDGSGPMWTDKAFQTSLMPGISYFPTSRLGLQLTFGQLQFEQATSESQVFVTSPPTLATRKDKNLSAQFGLNQAAIGINFFLSK